MWGVLCVLESKALPSSTQCRQDLETRGELYLECSRRPLPFAGMTPGKTGPIFNRQSDVGMGVIPDTVHHLVLFFLLLTGLSATNTILTVVLITV